MIESKESKELLHRIAKEEALQAKHGAEANRLRAVFCERYAKHKKGDAAIVVKADGRVLKNCYIKSVGIKVGYETPDCAGDTWFRYTVMQRRRNSCVRINLFDGDRIEKDNKKTGGKPMKCDQCNAAMINGVLCPEGVRYNT